MSDPKTFTAPSGWRFTVYAESARPAVIIDQPGASLDHGLCVPLADLRAFVADMEPAKLLRMSREEIVKAAQQLTPEQVFELSVKAGIHNPDGTLTEKYGGTSE